MTLDHKSIETIYSDRLLKGPIHPANENEEPLQFIKSWLPKNKEEKILDAGCGNGRYALAVANAGNYDLTAIDLFESIDTSSLFRYFRASIDDTKLTDSLFTLIYCMSVIFYLPNPRTAMSEFYRILKPGGFVLLSAHTKHSLFTLDRKVQRAFGAAKHLNGVAFYSAKEYTDMLRAEGFQIVDVDGYEMLYSPWMVHKKILGAFRKVFGLKQKARLTVVNCTRKIRPAWLKWLYSELGYHSLIVAQKPDVHNI